jgi:diaminopimelate epimerase
MTRPLNFIKMHGLGNDYVYIDAFSQSVDDPAALAMQIADRHFGVGGDGLILAMPAKPDVEADARMRMFNADGSEAEMCGNGIRCVCKMIHDHRLGPAPEANPMHIQTGNGVLALSYTTDAAGKVDQVSVDMGRPVLDLPSIPVDAEKLTPELNDAKFVSMGNPHVVLFIDDDDPLERPELGKTFETHPAFPKRINVHFVRVRDRSTVDVYHWERGSGATLACGTGAAAVCVAGVMADRTDRSITAHLPGGPLHLEWKDDDADGEPGHVIMTGPAVEVFRGQWPG